MIDFGAAGYGAAAFLYAGIGLLSLLSWRNGRIGLLFIFAAFASAAWAGLHSFHFFSGPVPQVALYCAEVLRSGLWVSFLVQVLAHRGASRYLTRGFQLAWLAVLVAGLVVWVVPAVSATVTFAKLLYPGGVLVSLIGVFVVYRLYRDRTAAAGVEARMLALGLGAMFACDLFLYTHAVLFGAIDLVVWSVRGIVNCLFVPFVALAGRRSAEWDLDIFVSRRVVHYGGALAAVAAYLVLMAGGGLLIGRFGDTWSGLAQVVFFAGALLVLFAFLFSQRLRAELKVFVNKHFFRNKYDYREEWLRLTSTLSAFSESSTREIAIKAMAQIVGSRGGVLWNLDENAREFRPAGLYNTTSRYPALPLDSSMAAFLVERQWIIDVLEYRVSPQRYQGMTLPEWLADDPDAWLIVPLITRNRVRALILLYRVPGFGELNYEDRDLLKAAGSQVAVHLVQESSDDLLAQSRQFEAYNRLTAFLMHDLNNLIAQQSMIVKNAERHKRSPEFVDDAMLTISSSVTRMRRIMEQLKQRGREEKVRKSVLKFLVSAAVDRCSDRRPGPEMDLREADVSIEVDPERFMMVLAHLIRNAQEATPPDGSVRVEVSRSGGNISISVSDSGSGMTPEFVRDQLFRPFESTKGAQGMGIGVYQAREFARSMGGDLKAWSEKGIGTRMVMSFPEKPQVTSGRAVADAVS